MSITSQDWRRHAACRGMDPDLFFPPGNQEAGPEVRDACGSCLVRAACLDYGLSEWDGVFGGLTKPERDKERRRRVRRAA